MESNFFDKLALLYAYKNVGLCCNSSHIFLNFFSFLFKTRRGKQRQNCSQQNSTQAKAEFDSAQFLSLSDIQKILLSTPHSVSLCGVLLRTVLVTFGFSENIQNFLKYHHMDPKFPGNGDFQKLKKLFDSAQY